MRAKKCDRCDKLYEHYDGSKEFKNGEKANAFLLIDRDLDNKYWSRKSYDLCPECMKKLEEFLNRKDILEFLLDGNFREDSFSIEFPPGELMGTLELKGHTLKVYMGHAEGERLSFAGSSTVKRKFTIIEE